MSGAEAERAEACETVLGDVLFADRKPPTNENDWVALVSSIGKGDKGALNALYERTHRIVFTLIMRITRNRQTAEELTLDVFHDVWRRAAGYDPAGGSVVGWLMNQARSRAIDRLRFEQRIKRVPPRPQEPGSEECVDGPYEALEIQEEGRRLRAALATLEPGESAAIETAFFFGLTYTETAAQLGHPLGTVKARIRSGLDKLRQALAEEVK